MKKLGLKQGGIDTVWFFVLLSCLASLLAVILFVIAYSLFSVKGTRSIVHTAHEHEIVAGDWLNALEREVVEKTKDPQAETIFGMLKEKSEVVLPNDTGFSFIGKKLHNKPIRVLPLLASDKQNAFPLWQRFFRSDIAAAFVSDECVVVIKEDAPISPVFKGLILVHEGNHALKYLGHPYVERSNKEFSEEERDTHEFVAQLMAMIGGAPYEQLLLSEVRRMTTTAKQTAEGMMFFPSGTYHEELDKIFGPALSDSEKYKREKLLWLDTVFHFIDAYYDGNQEEKEGVKAEFLLGIYISQGMRDPEKS